MNARDIGRKAIKSVDSIVNFMVLTGILLLTAFAGYALWDSGQIYQAADKSNYEVYKPTAANEGKSFLELQAINEEVFAWLNVYGTNIDYPVTQGPDNMKYVNTNAEYLYSLSGAIFLDYRNNKDFSDFNSILYGHHMEKKVMFGEIEEFAQGEKFENNRYGNLYFDKIDHGIEFFAFIQADAYDNIIFTANVMEEKRREYLDYLLTNAIYTRDIGISEEDNIVLLSTCSSCSTNGRDILAGRISGEVFEDLTAKPYLKKDLTEGSQFGFITKGGVWPVVLLLLVLIMAGWLAVSILVKYIRRWQGKKEQKRGGKI